MTEWLAVYNSGEAASTTAMQVIEQDESVSYTAGAYSPEMQAKSSNHV